VTAYWSGFGSSVTCAK